jgi:hypothetical protein
VFTINKIIPHITASALVIVAGFFLYNFETKSKRTREICFYDLCRDATWSAEYGFRPYGVAVILIGAAYLGLILLKNWQDNQSLDS